MGELKAKVVAMENVTFHKHMSMRRDAALHDLWSLVASAPEASILERLRRVLSIEERALLKRLMRPVCECRGSSVRLRDIRERFHHEFCRLVDLEQVAHSARSSRSARAVAWRG